MRRALAAGLAGMRSNLKPGLVLWCVGTTLVLLYALVPAARPAYDRVEGWQRDWGLWFSILSTGLCGGVLPWLFLIGLGRIQPGSRARELGFLVVFWIYRGLEVALFYQFQTWLFGEARNPVSGAVDVAVVLRKMALDMLVYTAFWSIPTTTLVYAWWVDCRCDWACFRSSLGRDLFTVRLPALILAAWMVWAPSVCLVYSLPSALQVPIFSIVLCFWVLLVAVVAGKRPVTRP